jgi:hypothetical protein
MGPMGGWSLAVLIVATHLPPLNFMLFGWWATPVESVQLRVTLLRPPASVIVTEIDELVGLHGGYEIPLG